MYVCVDKFSESNLKYNLLTNKGYPMGCITETVCVLSLGRFVTPKG